MESGKAYNPGQARDSDARVDLTLICFNAQRKSSVASSYRLLRVRCWRVVYILTEVKRQLDEDCQTDSNQCASKRKGDESSSLDKFPFLCAGPRGWVYDKSDDRTTAKKLQNCYFQPLLTKPILLGFAIAILCSVGAPLLRVEMSAKFCRRLTKDALKHSIELRERLKSDVVRDFANAPVRI